MIVFSLRYNTIRLTNAEVLESKLKELNLNHLYKGIVDIQIHDFKKILHIISWLESNHCLYLLEEPVVQVLKSCTTYEERAISKEKDIDSEWIQGVNVLLNPFQFTGVRFLENCNGSGIIGLEVGTGKTLLALAYCIKNNKKAIIICPSQQGKTKKSIEAEIKKNTTKKVVTIWSTTPIDLNRFSNADFVIINYDLLQKYYDVLVNLIHVFKFEQLIVDEAHSIKNLATSRYYWVSKLVSQAKGVICLTGTAIKNNIKELYTLLRLVAPERFTSLSGFISHYTNAVLPKDKGNPTEEQLKKLHNDIQGCFFWRDKETILTTLPTTEYIKLERELTHIQSNFYNMRKRADAKKSYLLDCMIPHTVKLARELSESGKKTIVYTWFRDTANELYEQLKDIAVVNHGGRTYEENTLAYNKFKQDPSIKIIIATIKSFGESINLQDVADKEIFNDLPYTPADIEQCIGRISRSGQDSICKIYIQYFKRTIHENIIKILDKKYNIVSKILHNKSDTFSKKIRRKT